MVRLKPYHRLLSGDAFSVMLMSKVTGYLSFYGNVIADFNTFLLTNRSSSVKP